MLKGAWPGESLASLVQDESAVCLGIGFLTEQRVCNVINGNMLDCVTTLMQRLVIQDHVNLFVPKRKGGRAKLYSVEDQKNSIENSFLIQVDQ